MDYDKLIERMKEPDCDECTYEEKQVCAGSARCVLFEYATECIEELRANLERVTAERDAAISDLETVMAYRYDACKVCKTSQCYVRGGTKPCLPKWRGIKED